MTPDPHIAWPPLHAPANSLVFAQNVIDIAAAPGAVWAVLVDAVRWPAWYKHCSDVSILRDGPVLTATSKFRFRTLGFFFEPEIVTFEPDRILVWAAKGPAGTSGAHAWYIEPTPGGCRVVTEETQRGFLLLLVGPITRGRILKAHDDWLRGLKAQAEAGRDIPHAAPPP